MKITPISFVAGACILLAACATEQLPTLSGAEIQAELVGETFDYSGVERSYRVTGSMDIKESGELVFRMETNVPETGTWRIAGDEFCVTIAVARYGSERCLSVEKIAEGKYQMSDGYVLTKT